MLTQGRNCVYHINIMITNTKGMIDESFLHVYINITFLDKVFAMLKRITGHQSVQKYSHIK